MPDYDFGRDCYSGLTPKVLVAFDSARSTNHIANAFDGRAVLGGACAGAIARERCEPTASRAAHARAV